MPKCAFCQEEVSLSGKPGRRDVCPFCERDLHSCYQCRFYDESAHHQCREPQTDFVSDKEATNFCDYFAFEPQVHIQKASKEDQMTKLEGLFKKK